MDNYIAPVIHSKETERFNGTLILQIPHKFSSFKKKKFVNKLCNRIQLRFKFDLVILQLTRNDQKRIGVESKTQNIINVLMLYFTQYDCAKWK
jgi:hypothetical protein